MRHIDEVTVRDFEPTKEELAAKAGHTPGPWRIVSLFAVENSKQVLVADCHTHSGATDDEREANARLIATAPELLQALEGLTKELRSSGIFNKLNVRKHFSLLNADAAATKAIAEAKGLI